MSNPAKRRGTAFESSARDAMNEFFRGRHGLKAYRPAQAGHLDTGDLNGVSPFIVQAKAYADTATALREGMAGAARQALVAGEPYGVALLKRARRPVADAAAVMRLQDFARVLVRLRRAEALLEAHAPGAFLLHAAETTADVDATF